MIDKDTGEVTLHPEGFRIGPSTTEDEFLSLPISATVTKDRFQQYKKCSRSSTYKFTSQDAEGNCLNVNVLFSDSPDPPPSHYAPSTPELWWITLDYTGIPDMSGSDLDSIFVKKAWHDEWMRKILGASPDAEYKWGKVSSTYELHTPFVFIGIGYAEARWLQRTAAGK
jgi:hypothetical protein